MLFLNNWNNLLTKSMIYNYKNSKNICVELKIIKEIILLIVVYFTCQNNQESLLIKINFISR